MDDLPQGCCILEVRAAGNGYVMRLWNDGRWTEAWPGVDEAEQRPYETSLAYEEGRKRFAEAQAATWGPLLAAHDGETLGPFVAAGTKIPGGSEAKEQALTFRTRTPEGVHTVHVAGDLRVPAALGPLGEAWEALSHALRGPSR